MPSVIVPSNWRGVDAPLFGRNGQVPNDGLIRAIAAGANHILGRHGTIIPGMSVLPPDARNVHSDLRLWSTYYKATPNGTTLVSRVMMIPSEEDHVTAPQWYVSVDGEAQTTQGHDRLCASGAGLNPSDIFYRDQEIEVTAGECHRVDLATNDFCRVVGWQLWEKDRETLDTDEDTLANALGVEPWAGIFDAQWASLQAAVVAAWNNVRGSHMSFNVDDPASPRVPTATLTNIHDGSTSRTATTVGAQCPTRYRGSYLSTTVPVLAWALGKLTNAAYDPMVVRFAGASANIDVEVDGTAETIYTKAGTIDVADLGDKVDVQIACASYGGGVTEPAHLYACGMFPIV